MTEPGLRERKREATAYALAAAAFDLARTRGLDGFVIDDVTERAGYSRRTFANHYSCKEAAVAAVTYPAIEAAADALEDLGTEVPLVDAVQAVLTLQPTTEALTLIREVMTLARAHPSLEPHVHQVLQRMRLESEQRLRTVAADRYPPAYVSLLFGAVYGTVSAALEGSVPVRLPGDTDADPASMELEEFLDLAFHHLRTGF